MTLDKIRTLHSLGSDVRLNTTDETVIREIWVENVYRISSADCQGTVVDLGANIGAFTTYALSLGALRVIAVEPELENYEMLLRNCNRTNLSYRVEPVKAAIYGSCGRVHIHSAYGGSRVSLLGEGEDVSAITLQSLFEAYNIKECSTLKMDVEGSEYVIFGTTPSNVFNTVRYITMEFHATNAVMFGNLVAKLTKTHAVQTLGSYERGGYIYARRY